jgi:hypothetical protein
MGLIVDSRLILDTLRPQGLDSRLLHGKMAVTSASLSTLPSLRPGAATHVLNVHMIGKNLANTAASLEDKNIVFGLKLVKINV